MRDSPCRAVPCCCVQKRLDARRAQDFLANRYWPVPLPQSACRVAVMFILSAAKAAVASGTHPVVKPVLTHFAGTFLRSMLVQLDAMFSTFCPVQAFLVCGGCLCDGGHGVETANGSAEEERRVLFGAKTPHANAEQNRAKSSELRSGVPLCVDQVPGNDAPQRGQRDVRNAIDIYGVSVNKKWYQLVRHRHAASVRTDACRPEVRKQQRADTAAANGDARVQRRADRHRKRNKLRRRQAVWLPEGTGRHWGGSGSARQGRSGSWCGWCT